MTTLSIFTPSCLLAVGVLCLSSLVHSGEKYPLKESNLLGKWALKCDESGWISIASEEDITMEVNANQIYIHATGEVSEKKLVIKLIEPADLGFGGMSLDWDNFSRAIPIAEMQVISDNSAKIKWFGFYNKKSNAQEWINEPDFFDQENNVLKKCSADHS